MDVIENKDIRLDVLNAYQTVLSLGLSLNKYTWSNLNAIKAIINNTIFRPEINQKVDYYTRNRNWRIGTIVDISLMNEHYSITIKRDYQERPDEYNWRYQSFTENEKIVKIKRYSTYDSLEIKDQIAKLNTHTPIHYYLINKKRKPCCNYYREVLCPYCHKLYCYHCAVVQIKNIYCCILCKNDIAYKEMYAVIINSINSLYTEMAHCIAIFAVGITVNCCNDKCMHEITFYDHSDFDMKVDINGNQIASYSMFDLYKNRKHIHNVLNIYGKKARVFCGECVKLKEFTHCLICRNTDVEHVCADHPFVSIFECLGCNDKIYLDEHQCWDSSGNNKSTLRDVSGAECQIPNIESNKINKFMQLYCSKCSISK